MNLIQKEKDHRVIQFKKRERLLCPIHFSRQEYQSRLSFPSPGNLPYPEIEPGSPAFPEPPGKPSFFYYKR